MDTIILQKENGVGYITLNRPEKYNSYNREMAFAFQNVLDICKTDAEIRCVYITGAGKGFCSGQDLAEAINPTAAEFEKMVNEHYNASILRIRNLEKPVIAAVNGIAAGAGANIALACDIVVAAHSAGFIQAFSKIGLIPDSGGTYFLPRLVGLHRAMALMMTAERVSATEAVEMGMIFKCFPDEDFEVESKKIALNLAQMPTMALGLTKRLLNKTYDNNLEQQLSLETEIQCIAGVSEDFKEGTKAFLEKRKPVFVGK